MAAALGFFFNIPKRMGQITGLLDLAKSTLSPLRGVTPRPDKDSSVSWP